MFGFQRKITSNGCTHGEQQHLQYTKIGSFWMWQVSDAANQCHQAKLANLIIGQCN